MTIYLAEVLNRFEKKLIDKEFVENNLWFKDISVLESYEYVRKNPNIQKLLPLVRNVIIDSGAFSYQKCAKGSTDINWEKYAEEYGDFIKQNDIKNFFELDIDNVVGYEEVKKLRAIIEEKAERKCIPVWHVHRGKEDYIKMCKDYDYVAIGGLVGKKGIKNKIFDYLQWFVNIAHENGTKIHGLGFTIQKGLQSIPFDSVDSTTWMCGAKYGELHFYSDGKVYKKTSVERGKKVRSLKNVDDADLQNLFAWYQLQKYARLRM